MADLEKLAIRRDHGYLVRLILMLGAGVLISFFLFGWLTGSKFSGCVAENIGGTEQKPVGTTPK